MTIHDVNAFFSGHKHISGLESRVILNAIETYCRRIGEQNCVLLLGVNNQLQNPIEDYILARVKDHMIAPERVQYASAFEHDNRKLRESG